MSIYLTGDIHGDMSINKLGSTKFPESHYLTKNDYIVILGDFGLIWDNKPSKKELYWLNWLDKKPWTTLFIDGNHENVPRINSYPEINMFDDKVGQISDTVYHLKRGRIYNIENKNIFTFGGGLSIDKQYRIENISWWKEEYPSKEEIDIAFDNLEKYNYKVDYIFTHTGPLTAFNKLVDKQMLTNLKFNDEVSKLLDIIYKRLRFNKWYFGHYHIDHDIDNEFMVLFDRIIKL